MKRRRAKKALEAVAGHFGRTLMVDVLLIVLEEGELLFAKSIMLEGDFEGVLRLDVRLQGG